MLPGIIEDETAHFVSFRPRNRGKLLSSSRNEYLEVLKKKIKQMQTSAKIKIPDALKQHRKRKEMLEYQSKIKDFPCMQQMFQRFNSRSKSPDK